MYVGRFAPSPSGDLHFGSLVTALASYLLARQQQGRWLLRIDDIDQPRCKPGSDSRIMQTLESHGLCWDGSVLYQSQRQAIYDEVLHWLVTQKRCYGCQCTRKRIKAKGEWYDGTCRNSGLVGGDLAMRLLNPGLALPLLDVRLGQIDVPAELLNEDFVLRRRDGIYGYHLVAVVDDIAQGVTQVVRGADLLFPSACQNVLYHLLQATPPEFVHIPVAVSRPGHKLSKQNHSPELPKALARQNLCAALHYLGCAPPVSLQGETVEEILHWGIQHWQLSHLTDKIEKTVAQVWC